MAQRLTKSRLRRIGIEFSNAVGAERVNPTSSYLTKIRRIRRLQAIYCERLSAHPKCALELRRRIAKSLFDVTIFRPSQMRACRARFKSLSKLGFTDIEDKGHIHLMYARAALARGHRKIARQTAARMARELSHSLAKKKSLLGHKILGHLHELLKEL
jgi:hypothetical protein